MGQRFGPTLPLVEQLSQLLVGLQVIAPQGQGALPGLDLGIRVEPRERPGKALPGLGADRLGGGKHPQVRDRVGRSSLVLEDLRQALMRLGVQRSDGQGATPGFSLSVAVPDL